MKQIIYGLSLVAALVATTKTSAQRRNWNDIRLDRALSNDTITQKKFTAVYINLAEDFDPGTGKRMIETFFKVYPKEAKLYNQQTLRRVTFVIDPEYQGVAAASGGIIKVNPEWMTKNPEDLDVITHEAMHIVQQYPGGAGPGWITEGIADYVRYELGVNNPAANWSLPALTDRHHYTNAYRVTARFLVWIVKNYDKKFVRKLDRAMRSKTYTEQFWKQQTGKTVDELWEIYKKNPVI